MKNKILTIRTYNYTREHSLPHYLPIDQGESIIYRIDDLEDPDLNISTITLILKPETKIKPIIDSYINYQLIPKLKEIIEETSGDDSYYDCTPDFIDEVCQFLLLVHKAKLIDNNELQSYFRDIKESVVKLYGDDPERPIYITDEESLTPDFLEYWDTEYCLAIFINE